MSEHDDFEPHHASSPTDHVLQELQLYGYRPFEDEPDPRPLPEGHRIAGAIADIFDALISTLDDTRLEPDLDDPLRAPPAQIEVGSALDDAKEKLSVVSCQLSVFR